MSSIFAQDKPWPDGSPMTSVVAYLKYYPITITITIIHPAGFVATCSVFRGNSDHHRPPPLTIINPPSHRLPPLCPRSRSKQRSALASQA